MAGLDVVIVNCDKHGNVDLDDLREKAVKYRDKLAAFMVTYPSTHGVYEPGIIGDDFDNS
jgi:glycine dehydrogenase